MAYDYSDPFWGNGFRCEGLKGMTPHNTRMLPGRILVRMVELKYEGLIEIPETAVKEPVTHGLVITVGPGPIQDYRRYEEHDENGKLTNEYLVPVYTFPPCAVGDIVLIANHVGVGMSFDQDHKDGVKYRILKAWEDVLAVFTPEEESKDAGAGTDDSVASGSDSDPVDD